MMCRDKYVVFAGLLLLILAVALFAVVWPGKPPRYESLNVTASDDFSASVGPPIDIPTAATSNISNGSSLVLEILKVNTIGTDFIGGDYEWHHSNNSTFDVLVLRSDDPACGVGGNFVFRIDEEMAGYWGIAQGIAPAELLPGTIIEIIDYRLINGNLTVTVSADPYDKAAWDNAWKRKIAVLGQAHHVGVMMG